MFLLNEIQFIEKYNKLLSNQKITNVNIDGRKIQNNGLYVPIKGETHDGHTFLKQAIENGAIASFWESNIPKPNFELPDNFELIEVASTYQALYQLASFYRKKVNPIVIGITGSNGKTTTKDILYSILSPSYRTHKTNGNLNNHFGVPLTILSMKLDTQIAIVEMGMSDLGEIHNLSVLAEPDYAVITNIGESHLLQLKTRENIAKAKSEIIDGLKLKRNLIYDGDELLLKDTDGLPIKFGPAANNVQIVAQTNEHTIFSYENYLFTLPILGTHHAKNASYAITIAKRLNVPVEQIISRIQTLDLTGMRMEKVTGLNGSLLMNDAYNASPVSMKGAIQTLEQLQGYSQKILVIGDMLELGDREKELHESVVDSIENSITHVFTIGKRGEWIYNKLREASPEIFLYHSLEIEEILKVIKPLLSNETVLLAKASRGMKLDRLIINLKEIEV